MMSEIEIKVIPGRAQPIEIAAAMFPNLNY
jgi:hypothetical protein